MEYSTGALYNRRVDQVPDTIRRRWSYKFWHTLFQDHGTNFNLSRPENALILADMLWFFILTSPTKSYNMESAIQAYKDVYNHDLSQDEPIQHTV